MANKPLHLKTTEFSLQPIRKKIFFVYVSRPVKAIQLVPLDLLPRHHAISVKVLLIILFVNSKRISHSGNKLESKWGINDNALVLSSPL